MRTNCILLLGTGLAAFVIAAMPAFSQNSAFTYQGHLNDRDKAANGTYDLTFSLFDSESAENQIGSAITNSPVAVTNGLFTVTLDFGPNFPGADRWLEIGVRTNGGSDFSILKPRQRLAPTPYAITANNLSGTLAAAQLSGVLPSSCFGGIYSGVVNLSNPSNSLSGNGAALTDVNAATLGGLGVSQFWQLSGNTGTTAGSNFLGTTDNTPLEFWANGQRALRLEPTINGPNVIAGFSGNIVSTNATGVTIGGGGGFGQANLVDAYAYFPGGHSAPPIYSVPDFETISGGSGNQIVSGGYSTIGGGEHNSITGWNYFTGGDRNIIGGGADNTIDSVSTSTIAGGQSNLITGSGFCDVRSSTIGGGSRNWIDAYSDPIRDATIAGGADNYITSAAHGATIGGGIANLISRDAAFSTIAGGLNNYVTTYYSFATISGGVDNWTSGLGTTVCGGGANQSRGDWATIAGGGNNLIDDGSPFAAIGGGSGNLVSSGARYSTIPGGISNEVRGAYSLAAGTQAKALYNGDLVWSDPSDGPFASTSSNQFLVRATGGVGINTNDPAGSALSVAGDTRLTGLVRAGAETGTSEPPDKGLVTRRIRSTTVAAGSVVARTDVLTLERDGTRGGWRVSYPALPSYVHVACMGVSSTGATANFANSVASPTSPGTVALYADAQDVVFFRCSFGNGSGELTEVSLTRFPGDLVWSGTLTSTFNQ